MRSKLGTLQAAINTPLYGTLLTLELNCLFITLYCTIVKWSVSSSAILPTNQSSPTLTLIRSPSPSELSLTLSLLAAAAPYLYLAEQSQEYNARISTTSPTYRWYFDIWGEIFIPASASHRSQDCIEFHWICGLGWNCEMLYRVYLRPPTRDSWCSCFVRCCSAHIIPNLKESSSDHWIHCLPRGCTYEREGQVPLILIIEIF